MGRRTDETKLEIRRVVNRARRMTREDGVGPTARFFGGLVVDHLVYPIKRRRQLSRRFELFGEQLPYAYHLYSQTWRSERYLEIAVAHWFLSKRPSGKMLELGNVMGHFGYVGHDVIDLYEPVEGMIREDIVGYTSEQKYDTVVSISTLEHVRFDEPQKDPRGSLQGLEALRGLLKPGGRLLVTVPLGYNEGLDEDIRSGRFSFEHQAAFRRVSKANEWVEVPVEEGLGYTYGSVYDTANAVLVGIDGPLGS